MLHIYRAVPKAVLQAMRGARAEVVRAHDKRAWAASLEVGRRQAEALVAQVRAIPELRVLVGIPVLAAMLCSAGQAAPVALARPRATV